MSIDVVHINAGEEELVEDDGAEVLILELLSHGDEGGHQTVHERVLKTDCGFLILNLAMKYQN
jgi:hypothetical protein